MTSSSDRRIPWRSRLLTRMSFAFVLVAVAPLAVLGLLDHQRMEGRLLAEAERRHEEVARNADALVRVWLEGVESGLAELSEAVHGTLQAEQRVVQRMRNPIGWHLAQNRMQQGNVQAAPFNNLSVFVRNGIAGDQTGQLLDQVAGLPGGKVEARAARRGKTQVVREPLNQRRSWVAENFDPSKGADGPAGRAVRAASSEGAGGPSATAGPLPAASSGAKEDAVQATRGASRSLAIGVPLELANGDPGVLVGEVDTRGLAELLQALGSERYGLAVRDREGSVFVDTFAEIAPGQPTDPAVWIAGEWPMRDGAWRVQVGEPAARVMAPLAGLRRRTAVAVGGAALVAALLGLLVSMRITRPVERLERRAASLASGDWSVLEGGRAPDRSDEIGRLTSTFERMAGSLAQLDRARGRFVRTVSHELRTPITSLRLTVANLTDGVVGAFGERQERALARVSRELAQLESMVEDMLDLTRLEAGSAELRCEERSLQQLVASALSLLEAEARRRQVRVVVQGPTASAGDGVQEASQDLRITTDAKLFERVLVNLLHNAIKVSPSGGEVCVTWSTGELRIQDSGPGWPEDEDPVMERGSAQPSVAAHGFGLSIAARIAELLSLQIALQDAAGLSAPVDAVESSDAHGRSALGALATIRWT